MITGGNATVFVSNMDRAVEFYTGVLGLKLTNRFGDNWATVEAGRGLTIGLHPASPKYPAPGTKGGVMLGLEIEGAIDRAIATLSKKGVQFKGPVVRDQAGNFVHFDDPDGNEIYLWEVNRWTIPESELALETSRSDR
ncbi:MAG TPA: VOC family protein [Bryobacteraceae bacterium]|nr:VOC family protein [Bryobacteraceae bacterium]